MKDNVLESFVQAANKYEFTLDISLNINGAVVTGTMISAGEYFKSLSEEFAEGNEVAEKLAEQLSETGENAESSAGSEANFIHLKDTKIYNGDSKATPSKGKILWRGKLDEVDGFFLGKISSSNAK